MNTAKRAKRFLLILAVPAALLALLFLLFELDVIWFNMPPHRKYPVRGVDTSHYQGQTDWTRIAQQGITFAFLKATEGSGTTDEYFAENWENARAAGLYVGAYHFFSFDSAAETQADNFIAAVPVAEDALPPVIDLEFYRSENLPDADTVRQELRTLLSRMRSTYGKRPIIYTTNSCWERYLADTDLDYTLWIRSVFSAPSAELSPAWTFWQYNPHGLLDGYTGEEPRIDLNLFRGSMDEFLAFAAAHDTERS